MTITAANWLSAELVRYIGEYDLPLDKKMYWAWTTARPRLVDALKKLKR